MSEKKYETDLYEPIKKYFEAAGYTVRGEVKGCDLAAVCGDDLVIVEMKLDFNFKLLIQAVERQKISPHVFIAIDRPARYNQKLFKQKMNVLKKLEIGLITVALDSPLKSVDVWIESGQGIEGNKKKKAAILKEIGGRGMDNNRGGSVKRKLSTAYRERAVKIACMIEASGSLSIQQIKMYIGDTSVPIMLQRDYYGWFERVSRGVYGITKKCEEELVLPEWKTLVEHYRQWSQTLKIENVNEERDSK